MIAADKGLLRLDALKEILAWQEGDEYRYERNDYIFIINLMKKFELCYELNAKEVLLPQLLDVSEPSFDFERKDALRFVLHYEDFLPPSVMPRFIVKRHHEIKDTLQWRSGVVLQNPMLEATAVVKADVEARRIHIEVSGTQRKAFLTVIMLTLREINSGFPGLKVSERVPMPDDPERTVDCEHLRTLLELKQETYTPEGSKKVYKVRELLDTVDDEKMLKILAQAGGEAQDKESFLDVVGKNLKAEPELFGFGINLKVVAEDLWLRYRAKRGGKASG